MKKTILAALLLLASSMSFASQDISDVLGDGRSTVFPKMGSIIQVSGAVARNLMLAMNVEQDLKGDALGTITKTGENLKCTYLSHNSPNLGFLTYTCVVRFDTRGKAQVPF